MVDLVILEVVEVQAGVVSEEALVVEAVRAEAVLAVEVLAVVPVGEEDNLSNI
jgi:hypothetical protein